MEGEINTSGIQPGASKDVDSKIPKPAIKIIWRRLLSAGKQVPHLQAILGALVAITLALCAFGKGCVNDYRRQRMPYVAIQYTPTLLPRSDGDVDRIKRIEFTLDSRPELKKGDLVVADVQFTINPSGYPGNDGKIPFGVWYGISSNFPLVSDLKPELFPRTPATIFGFTTLNEKSCFEYDPDRVDGNNKMNFHLRIEEPPKEAERGMKGASYSIDKIILQVTVYPKGSIMR